MQIIKTRGVNIRRGVREAHEGGPNAAFATKVGPSGFCMRSYRLSGLPAGRDSSLPVGLSLSFDAARGRETMLRELIRGNGKH